MYDNLIAQCSIHGGASDDDGRTISSSGVIKYHDPRSTIIVLCPNDITNSNSRVWTRLCYILRQNISMENLSISGNNSHQVSVFWACVGIQANTSIKVLAMSDIRLGGGTQLNILADFLVGNPRLERLTLNGCHLGPADIDCLSEKLMGRSYHSLEKLDLSGNLIGDNSLDRLVMALLKIKSVKQLNLGSNDMGERGVTSLTTLLDSDDSVVEELDISNNSIRVEAVSLLLNSLRGNDKLKRLSLNDNRVSDKEWASIFQQVLQIVYNNSSISNVLHSNHTLSSLGTHRGDPSRLSNCRRSSRKTFTPRDPMRELCKRCSGPHAQLLHASFCLNYQAKCDAFKARHKILRSHAMGYFNLGEDSSIDAGVMPYIFALIGSQDQRANLIQYHYHEEPSRDSMLNMTRLDAIYRILLPRPDLNHQND